MTDFHPGDHAHAHEAHLEPQRARPHMESKPGDEPGDHPADAEEFDRELNVPAILWTTAGVIATCLISVVAMWGMFVGFDAFDRKHAAPPPPMPEATAGRQGAPPGPLLQAAPVEDMDAMHAAEKLALEHAGWVDRGRGTVRVPIDVAIDVLAARGLPHPTTTPLAEMAAHGSMADDGRPPVDQPSPGTLLPPPGYGMGNLGPPSAGAGQLPAPAMPEPPSAQAPAGQPPAAGRPAGRAPAPQRPALLPPPPPPPGGMP
jgi:hypothetical protein